MGRSEILKVLFYLVQLQNVSIFLINSIYISLYYEQIRFLNFC